MAPEQLKGQPATPASDLYSLGLVGYELLASSLPFHARTLEALLSEVLHKPVPPLAKRNPAVPRVLADIIHRAMAKRPADRYSSAAALRDDLNCYLEGKRTSARRYRYEFCPRDLIADRPTSVAVAGFANMVMGGLLCLLALLLIPIALPSATAIAALGLYFVLAGIRLYTGRPYARPAGWLALAATSVCSVGITSAASFSKEQQWYVAFIFGLFIAAVGAATLLALLGKRPSLWYRQLREAHQAYEAER